MNFNRISKFFLGLGYSGNENSTLPILIGIYGTSYVHFRGAFILTEFVLSCSLDTVNIGIGEANYSFSEAFWSKDSFLARSELVKSLNLENLKIKPHQVLHDIAGLAAIPVLFSKDSILLAHPWLCGLYIVDRAIKNIWPEVYQYVGIDTMLQYLMGGYQWNEIIRIASDIIINFFEETDQNQPKNTKGEKIEQNHNNCGTKSDLINHESYLSNLTIDGELTDQCFF